MATMRRWAFGAVSGVLGAYLVVALGSIGCEPGAPHFVESKDIGTNGLWVEFEIDVVAHDDEDFAVAARARFSVGNPLGTRVLLTDGDSVTVNGEPMVSVSGALFPRYEATIDLADTYEFVFTRPGERSYTSVGTGPPLVIMSKPIPGETYYRSEPLHVEWENNNAGGKATLRVGPHTDGYFREIDDTGAYTVLAGPSVWVDAGQLEFDAFARLRRLNTGSMDPDLNGKLSMHSLHTVTFKSVP